MSIENKLDKLAEESFKFHGEVRQYMSNTTSYIGAVSKNLNDHLAGHREELKSEIKESKRGFKDWFTLCVIGGPGVLSMCYQIFHFVRSK